MVKRLKAILAVMALAVAATGAATADGKGILRVGWPYEPASLDPHRANEDAAYNALRMMLECLVRNVDGDAAPGLASSWDVSPDNMEYTFHLRKSVYSDGSPVTAKDFQYGFFRLLDPAKAFAKADSAFIIKNAQKYYKGQCDAKEVGISVKDDYTLKLSLAVPTFPVTFSDWPFCPMSKAFVEAKGATYGAEAANLLTNGPYTLKAWAHDSKLVLVKNDQYWNAASITLPEIDAFINAAGDTAVDMMQAKELDLVELSSRDQVKTLTDKGLAVDSYTSAYQFLHINHKGKSAETGRFLSNANFRRALSYAIDRQALVSTVYTTSNPSTRLTAPNETGVKKRFAEEYPYAGLPATADLGKAKQYLALALKELGASESGMPTFTMLCYDSQSSLLALQAIQDMLKRGLGVNCVLDPQPMPSMISKAYGSDFDFWKGGSALGEVDWLDSITKSYTSAIGAPYNYKDQAFDALYQKAVTASTWKERKDRMFDLEKYYCENVVDLVLTWQQVFVVHSPALVGMHLSTYADYAQASFKK
jgi:ABC-type oligopeptide transport system, periplasmic component